MQDVRATANKCSPLGASMVLGLVLGMLHANAVEWVTHKYVLHGLGKQKGSLWRFHWAQHHRIARKNAMYDKSYEEPFWRWSARGKEIAGIMGLALLHLPLLQVAPYFTAAVLFSSGNYLYRHRKCHLDVEWGKKHMPHHYDHHMGQNQDANWCVCYPWLDWVLGTRVRSSVTPSPAAALPVPKPRVPDARARTADVVSWPGRAR
jgi:sterol desaturase/sphingolipid hydroxylase (fatty acid hydroxylase superfamily)